MDLAERNWSYPWYAVTKGGMYVMGFTSQNECEQYCDANGFHMVSKNRTNLMHRKPKFADNWTDEFPKDGIDGELDK